MKTLLKIAAFILLLLLVLGVYVTYGLLAPVGGREPKFVLLRPGSSSRRIAKDLRKARVIASWPAFLLLHYWKPQPLKAGEYLFDHPANALEVYGRLARGDIYVHTVVIPEGFNMWEVAAAVSGAGLGTTSDFLKVAQNERVLIADLDPEAQTLEGYLFPDTYRFTRTQTMHDIVASMVHRFRQEARELSITSDVHRIVTMASIVEKETAAPEERPLVASVYYNRLARRMAFGADPTVIYAALLAGRYRGAIFQSDLQYDSPYNTYRRPGMPPGPISNPGRGSLEAALHPAESNYLYFVSDNAGHHRFARNAQEHTRNVQAYRHGAAAH